MLGQGAWETSLSELSSFCGVLSFFSPLRFILVSFQLCLPNDLVRGMKNLASALFVYIWLLNLS